MPRKRWLNRTDIYEDGQRVGNLPEYGQWSTMLQRCKIGGYAQGRDTTYFGCNLTPEWESYDVWLDWARQQVGFLNKDSRGSIWQQDKDILFKGNKLYSPETCVFVPQELNTFLTNSRAIRGEYPVGVSYITNWRKYSARVSLGEGSRKYLGAFNTPEEAFEIYKTAKEGYAKQLAVKYAGLVDARVVSALCNYIVNIDD